MLRRGVAVSPGVVVGVAYCIHEVFVDPRGKPLEEQELLQELEAFDQAVEKAAADLRALYDKVASQVGSQEAEIFHAHEAILHDPAFLHKVREHITQHRTTAQGALHHVLNEYTSLFARTKDDFLKERLADLRDVIVRLSGHLSQVIKQGPAALGGEPLVVVADELLPSHAITLGGCEVSGIVTQRGGPTSHAAILARSRGIPAVTGVRDILRQVKTGDRIIVDGREGVVVLAPDPESEAAYRKLQREFVHRQHQLAENRDQPARTADGVELELLANVNGLGDLEQARAVGAAGVGLYRTEYLFLTHPSVPSEAEQLENYRRMILATPRHRITIRTLDIGGDKTIPYLGHRGEANPFLGWRSIRLSFEHPEFFQKQIRAVLQAAAVQTNPPACVQLMFPMVTIVEEMQRLRALVRRCQRQLRAEGKEQGPVQIGMMVEVPAAAINIDAFLPLVDFVSIGSNDLVQYLMAADRDNPKVSHLCQPLSPAVLRVLHHLIRTCLRAGKPVSLCGEMAGSPRGFLLLLGMGLRSFSMSPSFIPLNKRLASAVTTGQAAQIAQRALELRTGRQIRRFLAQQIHALCPDVEILDVE